MNEGKINTYNMVGNGSYPIKSKGLLYVNGKLVSNTFSIKKENISSMESYDAASGKLVFGKKGENGVLLLKTKS